MHVTALVFDTYGTLVDWRGSILAELEAWGAASGRGRTRDWERFLTDWKSCYRSGMDKVDSGEWPWTTIDAIYRRRLDELLDAYGLADRSRDEIEHLNQVWWRLHPWPDSVPGLTRLRARYILSPLSNASFAHLPWDCIITAENARCYKPRAEVYRMAIELLGRDPGEIMMVAAHNYDLRAARTHGMRTAFVPRPTEYGPGQTTDLEPEDAWERRRPRHGGSGAGARRVTAAPGAPAPSALTRAPGV